MDTPHWASVAEPHQVLLRSSRYPLPRHVQRSRLVCAPPPDAQAIAPGAADCEGAHPRWPHGHRPQLDHSAGQPDRHRLAAGPVAIRLGRLAGPRLQPDRRVVVAGRRAEVQPVVADHGDHFVAR